jgi:hypothetical protein
MSSPVYFNWEGVEIRKNSFNKADWLSRTIINRSLFGELDDELNGNTEHGKFMAFDNGGDAWSVARKIKQKYDSGGYQSDLDKHIVSLSVGAILHWSSYNFKYTGTHREKTTWIRSELFKLVETTGNTLIISLQNAAKNNPDYLQPHSKWAETLYPIIQNIHYIVGYYYITGYPNGTKYTPTLNDIFEPFVNEINRIFMSLPDGDVLIKYHKNEYARAYAVGRGIILSGSPYNSKDTYTQPDCKDPTKKYIFIGNSKGDMDDSLENVPVSTYCGGASRRKNRRLKKISRTRRNRMNNKK